MTVTPGEEGKPRHHNLNRHTSNSNRGQLQACSSPPAEHSQGFLNSTRGTPDGSTLTGKSDRIWGETIMNDDTWSIQPFLGLVPHFHADPVEGVPLVSTDGHWWWDGYAWTPAPELSEAGVPG
jgi:hypothetical protein